MSLYLDTDLKKCLVVRLTQCINYNTVVTQDCFCYFGLKQAFPHSTRKLCFRPFTPHGDSEPNPYKLKKRESELGVVVHACDTSTGYTSLGDQ